MYTALVPFIDLQDERHFYQAGEQYPRPGLSPSAERIAELAGSNNRMGYPLITGTPDEPENAEIPPVSETQTTAAPEQKTAVKARRTRKKG